MVPCPLCEEQAARPFLSRHEVAEELSFRDRFFARRFERAFLRSGLRDVTSMLLAVPAGILRCSDCGVLVREDAPDDAAFRDDRYDAGLLLSLHETHADAFCAKAPEYQPLLPPGSRVVEIGSYVGGFLAAAKRWGWRAIGLDIGRDATDFTRRLGFDVRGVPFEEAAIEPESMDAVFIWNCFEQLPQCGATLERARSVLRRDAVLVIRVPDADFYARYRGERRVLAYNGLLGWPHRWGFTAETLRLLAARSRFALQRVLRRPAMHPFSNALRPWARTEEEALTARRAFGWLEMTFVKTAL